MENNPLQPAQPTQPTPQPTQPIQPAQPMQQPTQPAQPIQQPTQPAQPIASPQPAQPQQKKSSALWFGVFSLLCTIGINVYLGLLASVTGIIFGIIELRKAVPRAKIGLILNIISLVFGLVWLALVLSGTIDSLMSNLM